MLYVSTNKLLQASGKIIMIDLKCIKIMGQAIHYCNLDIHHGLYQECNYYAFYNNKTKSIRGYICEDTLTKELYLCFMGNKTISNTVNCLKFYRHKFPNIPGRVHFGFWFEFEGCIKSIDTILAKLYLNNNTYKVNIIGHSMGAPLAVFASIFIDLLKSKHKYVYLVSSPKFSNRLFNQWYINYIYNHNVYQIYNIKYKLDPIPHLPPIPYYYEHLRVPTIYIYGHKFENPHLYRNVMDKLVISDNSIN